MANMKEISDRMKSIQDTMKITNAMYMISSSKLKKAQKVLKDTEPYFYSMQDAISRVLRHVPDVQHKYFDAREEIKPEDRKIGYVVVTADKGMAGAYNHNILKIAEEKLKENTHTKLFVMGELGRHYFETKEVNIDTTFHYTVQKPTIHRARIIKDTIITEFLNGELDEVHLIYTRMNSSVSMENEQIQLLPLVKANFQKDQVSQLVNVHQEIIALAPSEHDVLNAIIPNYLTGMIYACLVESYASEQNSRMTAMQSSTNSASSMLKELSISYNRARQAAITQEITEVIGGAKAQKKKD